MCLPRGLSGYIFRFVCLKYPEARKTILIEVICKGESWTPAICSMESFLVVCMVRFRRTLCDHKDGAAFSGVVTHIMSVHSLATLSDGILLESGPILEAT